ncbi:MAG: heme-degrading domain-containing protein [Devosia nanyangense]|uniref:Heme-degrading domain-containing protein n=1 Tax=Devosia nanyangense TaxID=1228055 RepID=A0A933KYA9_9HYPH|nr:heme-degrading domain-containing protein [Devosia nanyangense]
MPVEADLETIAEQEARLAFERFDEDTAFAIGGYVRDAAKALGKGVAVGVYLWDRTLFYGATAGASAGNRGWVERKVKLVQLQLKSSYRIVLERGDKPRLLDENWAIPASEYALAGGAFPITIKGVGPIGAAAASGLNERDDHEIVRAAICRVLGRDASYLALARP